MFFCVVSAYFYGTVTRKQIPRDIELGTVKLKKKAKLNLFAIDLSGTPSS